MAEGDPSPLAVQVSDPEKALPLNSDTKEKGESSPDDERASSTTSQRKGGVISRAQDVFLKLVRLGRVEERGIAPIPLKERTVTRTINVFTLWWSMNVNILG